jgi:hypothetical protein
MAIPEGMVVRASFRKIDGPFYIVISKMLRESIESTILSHGVTAFLLAKVHHAVF